MEKPPLIFIIVLVIVVVVAGVFAIHLFIGSHSSLNGGGQYGNGGSGTLGQSGNSSGQSGSSTTTGQQSQPSNGTVLRLDCTANSKSCPVIVVQGDSPSSAGFHGYADPTIRQDPQTGTLWMAYSWAHVIGNGAGLAGDKVLDTHLAYSTDGGKTWQFKGVLYKSQAVSNPTTGNTDYTSHEVMNLYPQVVGGVTYWYGIHSVYQVSQGGAGSTGEDYTKRWEVAFAPGTASDGPMSLANAIPEYLGSNITNAKDWPIAVNLNSLNSEVSGCGVFYEPSFIISNNNLYLFLNCTSNSSKGPFYGVFKTPDPQDNAPNWKWTYIPEGSYQFAGASDFESIASNFNFGVSEGYLTQIDIAPGKNPGTLLAIVTAAQPGGASGKISMGCVAAELSSIDPPKFVYNSKGQVQVDAVITSSDSIPEGPGSCTYSPMSATGMIIAHKVTNDPTLKFYTILQETSLFP